MDYIIGIALDCDNNKLYMHKNGTYISNGSDTGDPTNGNYGISITDPDDTDLGFYFMTEVLGDFHLVNGLSIKKVSNQSKVQTPRHIRAEDKVLDWRPAGKPQLSEAELVPGEGGERQQRQPPLQVEHAVQQQVQLQHPLSEHQQDAGDDTADFRDRMSRVRGAAADKPDLMDVLGDGEGEASARSMGRGRR